MIKEGRIDNYKQTSASEVNESQDPNISWDRLKSKKAEAGISNGIVEIWSEDDGAAGGVVSRLCCSRGMSFSVRLRISRAMIPISRYSFGT